MITSALNTFLGAALWRMDAFLVEGELTPKHSTCAINHMHH